MVNHHLSKSTSRLAWYNKKNHLQQFCEIEGAKSQVLLVQAGHNDLFILALTRNNVRPLQTMRNVQQFPVVTIIYWIFDISHINVHWSSRLLPNHLLKWSLASNE